MNHSGDIGKRHTLMNKTTFFLLWLVTFTIPFSEVVELPGFGTMTRAIGYAALLVGLVAAAETNRHARLHGPPLWALGFVAWAALSVVWTVDMEATIGRVPMFVRCLGLYWLLYEYVDGTGRVDKLFLAYILGGYICIAGLMLSAVSDEIIVGESAYSRYSMGSLDPNDLAAMLAIGIPMAWHLAGLRINPIWIWICRVYVPVAAVAVLLTGSRGGLVAAIAAITIVPVSMRRLGFRSKIAAVMALCLILIGIVQFVPDSTLQRLGTIPHELARGTMSGRRDIWEGAIVLLKQHYILGLGAGALDNELFALGVFREPQPAHNTLLGVLCQLGIVGGILFTGLVATTALRVLRLRSMHRRVCSFVLLAWLAAATSLSWEYQKITWLIFGLLGAIGARNGTATRRSLPIPSRLGNGR